MIFISDQQRGAIRTWVPCVILTPYIKDNENLVLLEKNILLNFGLLSTEL